MLPPARVTRASDARARKPSISSLTSASLIDSGSPSDSSASRGAPPIAAMSERLTASAFHPMSPGELSRRSKCTDSTRESVVRISSAPRSGFAPAASSPIPTASHAGAVTRARMDAMRSRSPVPSRVDGWLTRVFDSPCFTDDGDLDLARVLELVFDPLSDVLREPDGLLVADAIAFDDNADLAARLQRERLRHALERIGDALELFEAFDVGLEDVAPGAGASRGDGVRRLHDHRFERRPVDIHVMRRDGLQDRLALPVLAQEV